MMKRFKINFKGFKSLLVLIFLCCSMTVSAATHIEVTNAMPQKRSELIEIPYADFQKGFPWIKGKTFQLTDAATNAELTYQLVYKGNKEPVALLIAVTIAPKGTLKINVKAGKPRLVAPKTFARFVPERYDDFAWENDKVAFRLYGAALDGRKDNAYGMDVWAKRTDGLVIDKWYKSGDYHTDHGEGMDYYSVGLTLGGGDIAPFVNDSIYFTHNYKTWKVLDNGPLRSTFQLNYPTRNAADIPVTVTKIISLDAGSQLSKIEATFDFNGAVPLPIVVGIVKRNAPGAAVVLNEKDGIMAYWEPETAKNGVAGVGSVFIGETSQMKVDKGHLLTQTHAKASQPYIYYAGAAWNRAGKITSAQEWINYLSNFKTALNTPLQVKLK